MSQWVREVKGDLKRDDTHFFDNLGIDIYNYSIVCIETFSFLGYVLYSIANQTEMKSSWPDISCVYSLIVWQRL